MVISSRTPEGFPTRCVLCGAQTNLEFSDPAGDAPCPNCGHLLWHSAQLFSTIQNRLAEILDTSFEKITAETSTSDLAPDSLDTVELIMQLEEYFDLTIPNEAAERLQTVGDIVRYLEQRGGN